jgi:hypothetical protein
VRFGLQVPQTLLDKSFFRIGQRSIIRPLDPIHVRGAAAPMRNCTESNYGPGTSCLMNTHLCRTSFLGDNWRRVRLQQAGEDYSVEYAAFQFVSRVEDNVTALEVYAGKADQRLTLDMPGLGSGDSAGIQSDTELSEANLNAAPGFSGRVRARSGVWEKSTIEKKASREHGTTPLKASRPTTRHGIEDPRHCSEPGVNQRGSGRVS